MPRGIYPLTKLRFLFGKPVGHFSFTDICCLYLRFPLTPTKQMYPFCYSSLSYRFVLCRLLLGFFHNYNLSKHIQSFKHIHIPHLSPIWLNISRAFDFNPSDFSGGFLFQTNPFAVIPSHNHNYIFCLNDWSIKFAILFIVSVK